MVFPTLLALSERVKAEVSINSRLFVMTGAISGFLANSQLISFLALMNGGLCSIFDLSFLKESACN